MTSAFLFWPWGPLGMGDKTPLVAFEGPEQGNAQHHQHQQLGDNQDLQDDPYVVHGGTVALGRTPINPGFRSNCTSAQCAALVQFDLGL